MERVIGLFTERGNAERALDELDDRGFTRDEVSILAQREVVEDVLGEDREEAAVETAGAGAVGGSAIGGLIGLIAGASALVVPGIGPALAVGTWATVLGTTAAGAGIGAAYGGLVGALIGFGVAEEQTHVYLEGVQRGGVLIMARTEDRDRLDEAARVMEGHDGIAVDVIAEPESG